MTTPADFDGTSNNTVATTSDPYHLNRPQSRRKNIKLPRLLKLLLTITLITIAAMTTTNIFSKLLRPFTSSSTRMSLAPDTPSQSLPANTELCTLAAGCFWGVEHRYRHQFGGKGLLQAKVGYIGGDTSDPSYRAVCSGRTGHAEALQVAFDPSQVSYESLVEFFYKMHDPTTSNRQGPDVGSQYRSGIFYHDEEQKKIAESVTEKVQKQWWKEGKVATQILSAGKWWDAEDYHQRYLELNPGGYDCPTHFVRSFPPLS